MKQTGPKPSGSWLKDAWHSRRWALKRQQLLRSDLPILVGPWRSEVGFEALYWLPFLDQLVKDGVARDRLIPIGRGGSACWYQTPQGIELFALRTPQQVRVENKIQHRQTAMLKQIRTTAFDRAVLSDAASACGLTNYQTLHPKWMYTTLAPFWNGATGLDWLSKRTLWRLLPQPQLPGTLTLPETFAAVRFYLRPTFRGHDASFSAAKAVIRHLSEQMPVYVLHSDLHVDDHADIQIAKLPNVHMLRDVASLTPETNLATQSAVLARAHTFAGTYGGFAQLALRFGRSVVSFYDQWNGTAVAHKHLAEALAMQMGVPFQVFALTEIGLTQGVIPPLVQKSVSIDNAPQPVAVG